MHKACQLTDIQLNLNQEDFPGRACTVVFGQGAPASSFDKPCIFPFTWRRTGRTYRSCVQEPGDSFPWCSTKVDEKGVHVAGQGEWGRCGDGCPGEFFGHPRILIEFSNRNSNSLSRRKTTTSSSDATIISKSEATI